MNSKDRGTLIDISARLGLPNPDDRQLFGLYAIGVLRDYLISVEDEHIKWAIYYSMQFHQVVNMDYFPFTSVSGLDQLVFKERNDTCQELYNFLAKKSFDDFIRIVVPSLAGLPQELYRKICSSQMPNAQNIPDNVWVALQFFCLLQDKTSSEFDSIEEGFRQYRDYFSRLSENAKALAGGAAISHNNYKDIFALRYQYLISASSAAESIYTLLDKLFPRPADKCEVFFAILSFYRANAKKDINFPYRYYAKIHSIDPRIGFSDYEKIFNQIFDSIKGGTVSPIDFLDVVFNHEKTSDSRLEVDFVYHELFKHGAKEQILLINPSISFLKKVLLAYDSDSSAIKAVFAERSYYELIQTDESIQRPGLSFSYYDGFCESDSGEYSAICLFATPMPPEEVIRKAISAASSNARIMALLASVKRHEFVTYLRSLSGSVSIEFIHYLSAKCSSTTPKKKLLIDAQASAPVSDQIPVRFYATTEDLSTRNSETLISYISYAEWEMSASLYSIVANQKKTPREKQRYPRTEFKFSSEISVWYSSFFDKRKLRYRVCLCQKRVGSNSRKGYGRIIPETDQDVLLKDGSEEELAEYVGKTYLFKPGVRSIVIKAVNEEFQQNKTRWAKVAKGKKKSDLQQLTFSFKTFWYVHFDSFCNQREKVRKAIERLACGAFRDENIVDISASTCLMLMESFSTDTDDQQESLWEALDAILSLAVAKGFRDSNPIASVFAARKHEEAEFAAVRSALVRKSLTVEQTQRLIAYLQGHDDDPYALAVMLRLFTGLSATEITALRDNDLIKHTNVPVYFLAVHGTMRQGESSPSPFNRKEQYRRIPLIAPLEQMLLPYKGNDNRPLLKCGENQLSERAIREKAQKALHFVGIASDIIQIPRDDGGSETADLDAYSQRSDFFRENFKIFVKDQCKFSIAEINYLLGNVQKTTYASNYCDFANPFSQLKLQRKLWRGFAQFFLPPISPQIVTKRNTLSFNRSGTALRYDIDLSLETPSIIDIESDYGVSYSLSSLGGDSYDG